MNKSKIIVLALLAVDVFLIFFIILQGKNIQLLNSKGFTSEGERNIIFTAGILLLGALVPVFILTGFIARKYRSGNTKGEYAPDSNSRIWIQALWWIFPTVIVIIFAVITWKATHLLDPYRPIQSKNKPIVIEVVALRWKWLFIYPEENIATVNFIQFPVNTPVDFILTADAPMNSFWIPQLSGQMYAMAGMSTQLHVEALSTGDYSGSAAEISGKGFSGMKFKARASTRLQYEEWVKKVKLSEHILNTSEYNKLSNPSDDNPVFYYSKVSPDLFNNVIMKFTTPPGTTPGMQNMHM